MITKPTLLLFAYDELPDGIELQQFRSEIQHDESLSEAFSNLNEDLSIIGDALPPAHLLEYIMKYDAAMTGVKTSGDLHFLLCLN
jgi:hypothetical protein